jgi:hypothetical protein
MKKIVVVLGMHRSGTSVTARSLQTLGITLGAHLMEPQECNPKGFYEDLDIFEMNERILGALHQCWDSLTPMAMKSFSNLLADFKDDAKKLIIEKMQHRYVFAFKDPRTAILLSFWREVFRELKLQGRYVIVFRHPISVADSLRKRDDFCLQKSLLLWAKYNISILASVNKKESIFINYDSILSQPELQIARLSDFLKMPVDADALNDFQSEFLERDFRHSIYSEGDLSSVNGLPTAIRDIYGALLSACTPDGYSGSLRSKAKSWSRWYDSLSFALGAVDDARKHKT